MTKSNSVFYWLPCSVVFISTAHGGRQDIMTATAMFVSEKEPLVAVSVACGHLTDQLIEKSGEFALAIAAPPQIKLANQLGSLRGEAVDKIERLSVPLLATREGKPSVPAGSAAWMLCRVEKSQEISEYRLIVGRVTAQDDLGPPPLVWQRGDYFSLTPL